MKTYIEVHSGIGLDLTEEQAQAFFSVMLQRYEAFSDKLTVHTLTFSKGYGLSFYLQTRRDYVLFPAFFEECQKKEMIVKTIDGHYVDSYNGWKILALNQMHFFS